MAATKRSANGRQLLLLAALLFGIVTMHTLGHPTGHSPSHGSGTEQAGQSERAEQSEQAVGQHEMSAGEMASGRSGDASAHMPEDAPHTQAPPLVAASAPAGTGGMDPLSVCLAVLAAFTLVLLLRAGLLRPGGFLSPARPLSRLLDGLRPNPPPPRILLSQLSVLRI
ncbi:hypothetical protein ACGFSB_04245 [Streptomyces sp. NPDC048441]|uniref:hypothetical protein n=1 Tax=Streptomyces sp. NPDC048441 TaxID=3365552 RepID=UPI0037164863